MWMTIGRPKGGSLSILGGASIRVYLREETAEHAMCCFVDLVRTLLGESAVADDKCECGHSLVVLGVEVLMADNGYAFRPAKDKVINIVCQ